MFLAIVFFFGTIVLWCPGYLYPPDKVKNYDLPSNPWVPTITAFVGALIYTGYHGWKYYKEHKLKERKTNSS